MKNLVIFTVFSVVIYKGKSYSKWFNYTKFPKIARRGDFQKISRLRYWVSTHKTGIFPKVHVQENPGKIERNSENASGARKTI